MAAYIPTIQSFVLKRRGHKVIGLVSVPASLLWQVWLIQT